MQRTLARPVSCEGVGLHSGRHTRLALRPAPADSGIVFHRTDTGATIRAEHDRVCATTLSTTLGHARDRDPVVGTIEHLMAALVACRVDNVRIELDNTEIPILDGSAAAWVLLIDCAGRREQGVERRSLRVLRTVRVEHGPAWAQLDPSHGATGLDIAMHVDFGAAGIGAQQARLPGTERAFRDGLGVARTFTFKDEITALLAAGLARGGSLDNAVVVDATAVLNPGGLRYADEFARHKALDVVGDLGLAGCQILGRFSGSRSGHRLNNELLRALFADPKAWTFDAPMLERHAA